MVREIGFDTYTLSLEPSSVPASAPLASGIQRFLTIQKRLQLLPLRLPSATLATRSLA